MKVIQQQITQDQAQLKAAAESANFNGQNFLSTDSSVAGYNSTKSFVSSYSRDSTGAISVGFINIDTSQTALFDSNSTGYDPTAKGAITTSLTASTAAAAPPAGISGANAFTATAANGQLQITSYTQDNGGANYYANTINIGNVSTAGGAPAVTETAGTGTALGGLTQAAIGAGDSVGGIATGTMAGTAAPAYDSTNHTLTFYALENDSANAGQYAYNKYVVSNFTPSTGSGVLDKVDTTTSGSYTDASGNTTNTAAGGTGVSIMGIDVSAFTGSAADMAKLNAFEKQVDTAISSVASSTATLGAGQARIESQSSFVKSLQTSITDGVGSLVDADLNVASTRLQALQVQQQLGVQSLSIANQSSQMILKLFG
jgi:flagellin